MVLALQKPAENRVVFRRVSEEQSAAMPAGHLYGNEQIERRHARHHKSGWAAFGRAVRGKAANARQRRFNGFVKRRVRLVAKRGDQAGIAHA